MVHLLPRFLADSLKNSKASPGDSIFILNYITDKEIILGGPKDSVFHVLRLLLKKGMCPYL